MSKKQLKTSSNGSVELAEAPVVKVKKAKEAPEGVTIPAMKIQQIKIKVIGVSPLIVNNFSEKSKLQMLEKQMKKAAEGKKAKDPAELYKQSLYWFKDKKRTGFPAVGFKAAMVRAGKQLGLPMTDTRGKFHVGVDEGDLVQIHGAHVMRDDMVRLATGVADIRFRGCYNEWYAIITINFNSSVISEEQLVQIVNTAGFACGIGEWRPEKSNSGSYGLFRVAEKGE